VTFNAIKERNEGLEGKKEMSSRTVGTGVKKGMLQGRQNVGKGGVFIRKLQVKSVAEVEGEEGKGRTEREGADQRREPV